MGADLDNGTRRVRQAADLLDAAKLDMSGLGVDDLVALGHLLIQIRSDADAGIEAVKTLLRAASDVGQTTILTGPDGLQATLSPSPPTVRLRPDLPTERQLRLPVEFPDLFELQVQPRPDLMQRLLELDAPSRTAALDVLDVNQGTIRVSFTVRR